MNNDDERDYEEETANRVANAAEARAEREAGRVERVSQRRACATSRGPGPTMITLVPSSTFRDRPGYWTSETVISIGNRRHRISYVDPLGTGRREPSGPELPGPYACAYPLADAIVRSPGQAEPTTAAAYGDDVLIDGQLYRIQPGGNDNIRLNPTDTQPPAPADLPSSAGSVADAINTAFDHIDSAIRTLDALTDEHEPGTPVATLGTMRRLIGDAVAALRAVRDHAETQATIRTRRPE